MKALRVRSVRMKMILLVVPTVAVAIVALTALAVAKGSTEVKRSAYATVASKAQAGANAFDATAEHYMSLGNEIATMLQGYHGPRAAVVSMMRANVAAHPEILGAYASFQPNAFDPPDSAFRGVLGSDPVGRFTPYWFWDHGKIATDRSSTAAQDYASAYYQQPEHTLANSFIEPYLYQGTLMTSYTAPILRDGHFIGIGGVDRSLDAINASVGRIKVFKTGYAFLVSHSGIFVAAPNQKMVGRTTLSALAAQRHNPVLARIAAAIKAGRSGQVQTTDPWTGKQAVMSYASIHDGGWGYVVVAPTSEMLAGVHSLRTTLILLGALALITIAAAVAVIATRFTRPIARIGAAAQRISEGDLDVTVAAHGEDEVAQTARSFGRMVDYLQEKATAAEAMAAGDFAVAVEARSERDVLGRAFADMRAKVAGMVREISAQSSLGQRLLPGDGVVLGSGRPRDWRDRPRGEFGRRRRRAAGPGNGRRAAALRPGRPGLARVGPERRADEPGRPRRPACRGGGHRRRRAGERRHARR